MFPKFWSGEQVPQISMSTGEDDGRRNSTRVRDTSHEQAQMDTASCSPTNLLTSPIEADSPCKPESPVNKSSSRSLTKSVYEFQTENGRTYHGYRAGTYQFPNDPTEQDRLDLQYQMLKCALLDRNYFAPLSNPKRILDIGTGTGQWAMEMGDEFPDAEVQGTDLSPIQPSSVPENVHFFIDDASEDDWALPPAYFDYIHTRVLLGCFTDFRDIINKGFHYLQPGGLMESQEIMSMPCCDDGTMPPDWDFIEWSRFGHEAATKAGRPLKTAHKLKTWYEQAGFVDVQEKVFKLPMNPWPKDKHLKNLGAMWEENLLLGLSGFSMGPFSRALEWSKDEIEVYLVNIRKAIPDRSIHAYHKVYVVWGRKPGNVTQGRP